MVYASVLNVLEACIQFFPHGVNHFALHQQSILQNLVCSFLQGLTKLQFFHSQMHQEIHNFKKKRVNYKEFIYSIGCAIKDLWGFYANSWSIVEFAQRPQRSLIAQPIFYSILKGRTKGTSNFCASQQKNEQIFSERTGSKK